MSGKAFAISSRTRDLIFILMLVSVIYFVASFSRSSTVAPEMAFPSVQQLEMFSLEHPLVVRCLNFFLSAAALVGICFLVIWICLRIYFLIVGREMDLSFGKLPPVCWNIWGVSRAGILFLYVGMVLDLLNPLPVGREIAIIAYNCLAEGIAVLYLFHLVDGGARRAVAAIGFYAPHFFRQASMGVLAYIAFIPIFIGLVLVSTLLGRYMGVELEPQKHFSLFVKPHSLWGYVFIAAFMAFVGPVLEEIFFRGFLYRVFKNRWGTLCAVLSSAFLFSVIHFNISTLLPIFGLGVLLAYVYERTGSLVAPIVIHVLQNSIALSVFFGLLWVKNTY